MPRPLTLFTGQWADLPLADLAPLVKKMGYDGVELACWGDEGHAMAGGNDSLKSARDTALAMARRK